MSLLHDRATQNERTGKLCPTTDKPGQGKAVDCSSKAYALPLSEAKVPSVCNSTVTAKAVNAKVDRGADKTTV